MYKTLWHHDIDRLKGKYVLVYNGLSQAIKIWTWIRNHPTIIKHRVHPYFVFALRAIASSSSQPASPPPGEFFLRLRQWTIFVNFIYVWRKPISLIQNLKPTQYHLKRPLSPSLCLSFLHHHHLNLLSYQNSLLSLYIYL